MGRSEDDGMAEIAVRCTMVSIMVLRGRDTLLVRRHDTCMDGTWTYVAGHVEPGESGWQAALRELREETALIPQALYATSFCEQFYDVRADCVQVVPAFVAMVDEEAEVRLNHEHSAFRWLPLAEAAEVFPFGGQRDLIAHVQREFVTHAPHPQLRIALE